MAGRDGGVPQPGDDGFELLTTFGRRARIGCAGLGLLRGPHLALRSGQCADHRFAHRTLESVTDIALFGGANALAIESAPGTWEIVQAGQAELIAPGAIG